jgi:CHAD domain-containing protein
MVIAQSRKLITISGSESINISKIKNDLGVKFFAKEIRQRIDSVANALQDYLDDADQETIHELRVAVRRFTVSSTLLPKKLRGKPSTHRFCIKSAELFRINTEIRDSDIIAAKLSGYDDHATEPLLQKLKAERDSKLLEARAQARSLAVEKLPVIRKKDLSRKRLQKKFNKETEKIGTRIVERLPIVVSDSKRIEDLHSLRKDCKRLRYLIELAPKDEEVLRAIVILHEWQDTLGSIRDDDITIEFLRKNMHNHPVADLLYDITSTRNKRYEAFAEQWQTTRHDEQPKPEFVGEPVEQVQGIQEYA